MIAHARPVLLLAIGAFIAGGAVLGIAAPAQAHNYLVQSTPSAGEVLTSLPEKFSVTTNDRLLDVSGNGSGFALQVRDAAGLYYGDGCITVDGPGMSTTAALGAPGAYTVVWQVISTDGHIVSDRFSFRWKPTAADATVSTGSKTAPDCHGTLPQAKGGQADAAKPTTSASGGTLGTVLWIGGTVLAVGLAVLITLLLTSRKKTE